MRTFSACESGDETVVRNFLNVGNHMSRVQNSRQLILVFGVFQNLNGVTRAQAFHKLRASSCTRKLRASPKSRKHFEHKFKSKLIYNERVTQHGGSYGVNQHSSNLQALGSGCKNCSGILGASPNKCDSSDDTNFPKLHRLRSRSER